MDDALKQQALILASMVALWLGITHLYDGYTQWSESSTKLEMKTASTNRISIKLNKTKEILNKGTKIELKDDIVNASLYMMFNAEKVAGKHGVKAKIKVRGQSAATGTVDFKTIAEAAPGIDGFMRIPITISITNWETSKRLFSWLDRLIAEHQFMPETIQFEGGMTVKGYIYGRGVK